MIPQRLREALAYNIANRQAVYLEVFIACVTMTYGANISISVSPVLARLVLNAPTLGVGVVMFVVGAVWSALVFWTLRARDEGPEVKAKRSTFCKWAAMAGMFCWLYLALDISVLTGGSLLWRLFSNFYVPIAVAAAVCYLRCDAVASSPPWQGVPR